MTDPWTPDALKLLAALRGGGPCETCRCTGRVCAYDKCVIDVHRCTACVAGFLRPDPSAAAPLADALAEALGGGPGVLPGLLCAYAFAPPPGVRRALLSETELASARLPRGEFVADFLAARGFEGGVPVSPSFDPAAGLHRYEQPAGADDPADRLALAAWHAANGNPGRAAAVRGVEVLHHIGCMWYVVGPLGSTLDQQVKRPRGFGGRPVLGEYDTEPAARAALVRAVLGLHDGDEVPCRACGGGGSPEKIPGGVSLCGACDGSGRAPLRAPCPGCGGKKSVPCNGTDSGWTTCPRCRGAGAVPPSMLVAPPEGDAAGDFADLREQASREIARGLVVPARLLRDRPGEGPHA